MEYWGRYAAAAVVTAVGAGVLFVVGAQTGDDTYALAGLVGVAMTFAWFLRYVHALLDDHAAPSLADPPDVTHTDEGAWYEPDRASFETRDVSDRSGD